MPTRSIPALGGVTFRRVAVPAGSRTTLALGAGLVVAWLAVLVPNLRLPVPSDALNYLQAAANFPEGLTDPDAPPGAVLTHQQVRFGIILPTRLAIEVFGHSQAAYYAVPVLAVLVLLVGVYALGCLLFSRAVGAGAAILVLSTTPILREQSYLMPDLFSAALFTAAIALCVAVRLRRLPRRWYVLAAIGVLLGWSYLVREFVVFGWALVPVLLWRRGRSGLRDLAWVAGPMLALWLTETALCWGLYGDPLLRLKSSAGHGGEPSLPGFAETYRDKPVLEYVFRLPEALQRYTEGRWLMALLALTIVGGAVQVAARLRRSRVAARTGARPDTPAGRRVRRQAVALLLLWCAVIWVPLTLLGGVLDPSAPKLRIQLIRYWFAVFPAFILGGLGVVWLVSEMLSRRLDGLPRMRPIARALPAAVAVVVAAVPITVSVEHLWGVPNTRAGGATHLEAFRGWMSRYEKTAAGRSVRSVWTDDRTDGLLRLFRAGPFGGQAWTAEVRAWRVNGPQPATGDLLVAYDFEHPQARIGARCADCREAMTAVMAKRPLRLGPALFATPDGELRVQRVLAPSTGPSVR